jgi:chlorobactene glucosyltransferase
MLSGFVVVSVEVGAAVVLLYQGLALWLARQMPRLDPEPASPGSPPGPKVSVVIAARDEESDLPATLDGLLSQDYTNLEVAVVEGGSGDRTREVIDARAPRVRRLDEPPLPAGWVGKNWACWTGATATDGEWLLFLDADVRLAPSAVRTMLAWAAHEGAALASIAPRVEMVGFWERVVLPFYVQMVLTYFRAPRVNRDDSRTAMANGQCWLVRRRDYDELGGHAAVRGSILEDVAIARRFRAAGRPLRLAWAPDVATTRMYRDRHEMFEGILKNVHGTEFSAWRQAGFVAGLLAFFWAPLALGPIGIALGNLPLSVTGAILAVALFGKHVAFARAVGAPATYGLLFPVAVGFYLVAVVTSLVRGLRGGRVTWKGRAYALGGDRSP